MRTTSSVVLRVVAVANHWIRPPLFRAASTLQPVRPLRVNLTKADSVTTEKPAWVVQRELSLRVKSLPSATDVLLEVKSWTGDTHNLRNLVTALHAVCGKLAHTTFDLRMSVISSAEFKSLIDLIAERLNNLRQSQHATLRVLSTISYSISKLCVDCATRVEKEALSLESSNSIAQLEMLLLKCAGLTLSNLKGNCLVPPQKDGFSDPTGIASDINRLMWGFAGFPRPYTEPEVYKGLAALVIGSIDSYNARELCTIAWSYSRTSRVHSKLFNAILTRLSVPDVLASANGHDLSLCVSGFSAVFPTAVPSLLSALAPAITTHAPSFTLNEAVKLLNALLQFGADNVDVESSLLSVCCEVVTDRAPALLRDQRWSLKRSVSECEVRREGLPRCAAVSDLKKALGTMK